LKLEEKALTEKKIKKKRQRRANPGYISRNPEAEIEAEKGGKPATGRRSLSTRKTKCVK